MPRVPASTPDRIALAAAVGMLLFAAVTVGIGAKERLDERRTVTLSCDASQRLAVTVEDTATAADYPCADLRGAPLAGRDLSFFSFEASDLTGADLAGASLVEADFADAILAEADLGAAFAPHADFDGAILVGAGAPEGVLTGASFRGVDATAFDLTAADLTGSDFTRANLEGARFAEATLEDVRWRDTICPDGVNSDDAGGSCEDHLIDGAAVAVRG